MSGVQTYHLEYTVDGWVNPASPQHSGDELYWNVIGNGWEIPISGVSVQVTGPGAGRSGATGSSLSTRIGSTPGNVPAGHPVTAVSWSPTGTTFCVNAALSPPVVTPSHGSVEPKGPCDGVT